MVEQIRDLGDSATFVVNSEGSGTAVDKPRHGVGDQVGRYVVLGEVGSGAMGVVYRAYDPKLQREVALKCVRATSLGEAEPARLVREAQAMAQLSDPNVVSVYDVEQQGDDVVLVMEFVEGQTLRDWLDETPRPWVEIVQMFRSAARGLAAAHGAGLLHRDFKPTNVLVGNDGRVRVTDFGLARLDDSAPHSGERIGSLQGSSSASSDGSIGSSSGSVDVLLTSRLTRVAGVVGTPRYMAPEQHNAKATLDARADQYAFCVSLWEALTGTLPFVVERQNWRSVAAAKRKRPPPWPGTPRIPSRVAQAIRRGLQPDPSERWPTMDVLIDALGVAPQHRRRIWTAVAGGATLLGSLAGAMAAAPRGNDACSEGDERIGAMWNEARRTTVLEAVRGIEAAFARDLEVPIVDGLDTYAQTWREGYADACEAHRVRREQSLTVHTLRSQCLHEAAEALDVTAERLSKIDAADLAFAHRVLAELPNLDRCRDVEQLSEASIDDRGDTRSLSAIAIALRLQRFDEAGELLDGTDAPSTRRLLLAGELAAATRDPERASDFLRTALRSGTERGEWMLAFAAAVAVGEHSGAELGQERRGEAFLHTADVLAERPGIAALQRSQASVAHGRIALTHGRFAKAEEAFRQALDHLGRDERAPTEAWVDAHVGLGLALAARGRIDEARVEFEAARQRASDALGPVHPLVGRVWLSLAELERDRGRFEQADRAAAEGRALIEAALGPHHPWTLEARVRATAIGLPRASAMQPQIEAMTQSLERLDALSTGDGGRMRMIMASALRDAGQNELARHMFVTAGQWWSSAYGSRDPRNAEASLRLGEMLRDAGELDRAAEALEQAWAIAETSDGQFRGPIAFALADVMWSLDRNRRRARALAETALRAAVEREDEVLAGRVRSWLASRA